MRTVHDIGARVHAYIGVALLAALGCATRPPSPAPPPAAHTTPAASSAPATVSNNAAKLTELRNSRQSDSTSASYVLGNGDLLSIDVANFPEMTKKVRVDADGTVTLPHVGAVPVAGKTLGEVQRDLTERIRRFMYNPNVTVFVDEYRSQQVAVMGAVQRPGLVSETGGRMSVLDAIAAAGGMTAEAGSRIYLVPAETRMNGAANVTLASLRPDAGSTAGVDKVPGPEPIMIDTAAAEESVQQSFFTLPVHGGDVITIPSAGQFVADGWVAKPGTYPVTAGLTVRGAIATAGGFLFPAKKSEIHITRAGPHGATETRTLNYDDVVAERAPDLFVHQGDVVTVGSSPGRLVPYGFYKVMADIIRVGAGIRVGP
jgi:polysaccharide export outer membrane protein